MSQSSYDAIGLFLCINIIQHFEMVANKRNSPAIIKYDLNYSKLPQICIKSNNFIFLKFLSTNIRDYLDKI